MLRESWYQRRGMWRSKVWKTGKETRVVSLPEGWTNLDEVYMSTYKSGLDEGLILRKSDKIPEIYADLNFRDHVKLMYDVIAAYINGYAGASVKIPKKNEAEVEELYRLAPKLRGTVVDQQRESKNTIPVALKFSTSLSDTKTILNEMYGLNDDMHSVLLDVLAKDMPVPADADGNLYDSDKRVYAITFKSKEDKTDALSFYAKRLSNHVQQNPDLIQQMGLENLSDVSIFYAASKKLEEAADLQQDILDAIQNLNTRVRRRDDGLRLSPFRNFYEGVYRFFGDGYKGLDDYDVAIKVLGTKHERESDEEFGSFHVMSGYVTKKDRLDVFKMASEKNASYANSLTLLQSKIWGLVEVGTTLAELGVNRRYPERLAEPPKLAI